MIFKKTFIILVVFAFSTSSYAVNEKEIYGLAEVSVIDENTIHIVSAPESLLFLSDKERKNVSEINVHVGDFFSLADADHISEKWKLEGMVLKGILGQDTIFFSCEKQFDARSFGGKMQHTQEKIALQPYAKNAKVLSKRRGPAKEVPPIFHNGIKYVALHLPDVEGKEVQGDFIEAWDIKTNQRLWTLKVYEMKYNPDLEADVQWVFITSMKLEGEQLIIKNERGEKFFVDLKTRQVSKKKWWQFCR